METTLNDPDYYAVIFTRCIRSCMTEAESNSEATRMTRERRDAINNMIRERQPAIAAFGMVSL